MKNKLTKDEFCKFIRYTCSCNCPKDLRRGQWMMGELYKLNSNVYSEIICRPIDPFYDDSKIIEFIHFLALWHVDYKENFWTKFKNLFDFY